MAITLKVEKRDAKADVAALRKAGKVPAVFYGKKEASTPISIAAVDFIKTYKQAGESSVVVLEGDGIDVESLIHDIDLHPVTGKPLHADFYVFEKGKKIKVGSPIEFVGTSPAIKELGGTLIKVLHELEIEALPKDLPHKIEVDISALVDFKSTISAKDIKLPAGVALAVNPDDIVASVAEPKEEVEEETAPVDLDAIEVEKKGKEAKEGEEGAEGAAPAAAPKEAKK
ncbi:MAG: 50S ribosomal protein L25 [Patescibacteria group bacterium]|nr:50S ribosomal protein L25 [Patescibacteria group bacterium]MDE2116673.1 50S ribosomal protein L25 [Patescibacteria group bacterium]